MTRRRLSRGVLRLTLSALLTPLLAGAQPALTVYPQQFTGSNTAEGGGLGAAIAFGGKLYFVSDSREEGRELWVTDGTPAGTALFADLCRGICSSEPSQFSVVGGRLFFSAFERGVGRELWVLEVGASAPRLFADINPGSDSSDPEKVSRVSFVLSGSVRRLDLVVASVLDETTRLTLPKMWRIETDGVSEELAGISTTTRLGLVQGERPAPVSFGANRLLVSVRTGVFSSTTILQQWVYGSDGRVSQVIDGVPGFPADNATDRLLGHALKLGGSIYLRRSTAGNMIQLWAVGDSPGGAVTQLTTQSNLRNLTAVEGSGLLYFTAGSDNQLFRSNASAAGTQPLGLIGARNLHPLGSQLMVFGNVAGEAGNLELHRSLGTPGSTTLVRELVDGSGGASVRNTVVSGDGSRLYLLHGDQLWSSDGSAAGTQFLNTLADASTLRAGDSRDVLLSAFEGEPHFSRGQLNDLRKLAEVRSDRSHSQAEPVAVIGQRLLYNAKTDDAASGLNGANRSDLGQRVRLLSNTLAPESAVPLGEGLLGQIGFGDAFFTDGIAPVTERARLSFTTISPACAVRFDGGLLIADPGSPFNLAGELIRIDGRPAGTRTVVSNVGFQFNRCFAGAANLEPGGSLLMAATPFGQGAAQLVRFTPPSAFETVVSTQHGRAVHPTDFARIGDRVFFGAENAGGDRELWVSDGTASGTRIVRNIDPDGSSDPRSLRVLGGRVVFFARTLALGREPWVSDGTEAGTLPLADLFPGPGSSSIGLGEEVLDQTNDLLLFAARVPDNSLDGGCPLFQTDGTPGGTDCVQPARALSNAPGDFAPARSARITANGLIAFVAHERERGEEVFVIRDRIRVRSVEPDLRPGARGSAPTALLADGNDIFFGADDGLRGSEMFRLSLDQVDRLFGNGFETLGAGR